MLPVQLLKIRFAFAPGLAKEHVEELGNVLHAESGSGAFWHFARFPENGREKKNPFSSVLFCSLLLKVNGYLCLSGAASQNGCSSLTQYRGQTKPGWEMDMDVLRGSPNEPICITCLQSGHPKWPIWETPRGKTSHLGGSHHHLSAVPGTSPSPTPLSRVLFNWSQQENPLGPSYPCKVKLAQEVDTRSCQWMLRDVPSTVFLFSQGITIPGVEDNPTMSSAAAHQILYAICKGKNAFVTRSWRAVGIILNVT